MVVAAKLSAEAAEARRVFEQSAALAKAANAGIPADELQAAVDEAIREVRAERRKKMKAKIDRT
jgi:hypothetical protein